MANIMDKNTKSTIDKSLGLLINGVELYSPSVLNESIYFGEITDVQILNEGSGYDVITPPNIEILDVEGFGKDAQVYANMKGVLTEALIISPGIGYNTKPSLSLVGGNFTGGASLETNLITKVLTSSFLPTSAGVGQTTITFIGGHNFENGEEIIYNTNSFPPVGGLVRNSSYFVGFVNSNTISLYNSSANAINKVNVINNLSTVVGVNTGIQEFSTRNTKNIIDKIYIKNFDGELYNKTIKIPSREYVEGTDLNGISTGEDYIYAKNHNLKEKDIVVYSSSGNLISGLTTTSQYYVTLLDENKFKLSDAGITNTPNDINYRNKVYSTLNSVGVGTHTFTYPQIEIVVSSIPGITSTISPIVKPVVLGSIDSIFIENYGVGYGVSEVVNLNKNPMVQISGTTNSPSIFSNEAVLQPIIVEGRIVDVQILNSGGNYQDNIDIIVDGVGKYAKLYPIITDGKISSVKILSTGVGYLSGKTRLIVQRRGKDSKFLANITKWTIDQYYKNKTTIDSNLNNGYVIPSKNVKNSLQFINLYPSKELRNSINDIPSVLKSSPILGWAYDGNPIIGPYTYANNTLSVIKSGYGIKTNIISLSSQRKRPPSNIFPSGYFVEDYQYFPGTSQLDEHNGMFINDREEFPKGTYAYFMTIDNANDNNPVYPYVIGKTFKGEPNPVNYDSTYNQNIDFTDKSFIKNTAPLYLTSSTSGYEYLRELQDKYKQDIVVTNTLASKIDNIEILNAGTNYQVGDKLIFKVDNSQDLVPDASISRLNGKTISSIQVGIMTYNNVIFKNQNNKIIGITSIPHTIENLNYINISNSTEPALNGSRNVTVKSKIVNLESNHSASGITTYVKVNDITGFSIDDYIQIDNEVVKIIEIIPQQSSFFVHRTGTLGIHTAGVSLVSLLPTKFEFNESKITTQLSIDNNHYFNPRNSVGLGTTGSIINNTNTNTTYSIPPQTLYIPNHQYSTSQELTYYNVGVGVSGILVSNTGTGVTTYRLTSGTKLYAVNLGRDYLGITTVSYGSTPLYFRESTYSADQIHLLKWNNSQVSAKVELSTLTIDTEDKHELSSNDSIRLSTKENTWDYYVLKFDFVKDYKIKKLSNNSFNMNLTKKPQFIEYNKPILPQNISYTTDSVNAYGSINDTKIITTSNLYKTTPTIESIISDKGENAILLARSNKIGRIDSVERIKDGFDYPSDVTLQPKLSTNTICYLDNINKVGKVNVLFGGSNYNSPPSLKVVEDDSIILTANLKNSTVNDVTVNVTSNNLSVPLEVIPINNSNGFDILDISVSNNKNRIEIDIDQFPLIYTDYAEPTKNLPFKINDLIFIENCRILESNKINYNSTNFSNTFFKVVGVNTSMGYIEYSTEEINVPSASFGTYDSINGYGTVVNKDRLAKFEMILEKNNYINGESVNVYDSENNIKFSGLVMTENGWNSKSNQLRLTKTKGLLEVNDLIIGYTSLLEGKVLYSNSFTMKATLGATRDKINYTSSNIENLNSDVKKIQDSNYYQDFSYSIKGSTPYEIWREPVRSIVHPSGFKEFSDLQIISEPSNNLKVASSDVTLELNIRIENENSFYTRSNYTIGYEDERINETTIERVYMGSGNNLWPVAYNGDIKVKGKELSPYLMNLSNSVIPLKDISSQFTGTYDSISLGARTVEFNSNSPHFIGVSTSGLLVGDIIGFSTYHEYPNDTKIILIGINSIRTLYPHKLYSGITTQSLEFTRYLNQNKLIGITSFTLKGEDDSPIYKVTGVSTNINVSSSTIELLHNFETGQIIRYENIGGTPIQITPTNQVIGGISTNVLPPALYGIKIAKNKLQVSGLSGSQRLTFTNSGSGIHKFTFDSPNASSLISIDNIIQSPIYSRGFNIGLSTSLQIGISTLYTTSGINSISSIDILKIENEYLKIVSVGVGTTNSIEIERGFLGTTEVNHTGILTASVYRGDYSIKEDVIHFTSPPFGPSGLPGIEISSKFSGRAFSRSFNSNRPNDRNLVLDDISTQFVGLSSFTLKENGNNVVGLYTNTNDSNLVNINNNPIILINNIPQVTNVDYEITTPNSNSIEFLNGTPISGKILKFESNQGFGYVPLVGAAATVSVSGVGTISAIYLNGAGRGYRTPPVINIISSVGVGASISATIGTSGTITNLSIINPGYGYTSTNIPIVTIDDPLPYYNLNMVYNTQSTGIGTGAKVSVVVGSGSSIQNIDIIEPGRNYKVGDVLNVVGLITNTSIGSSFRNFSVTVKEVISDTFTGIYPGQFLQFDDISKFFDSSKRVFDITTIINGEKSRLSFKSNNNDIEYNFFIFLNDILQEPKVSYNYAGGRLVFQEAPKEGSKCNILYYQGSIYDTQLVTPVQTLKDGDTIKLESTNLINEQYERVIKRIISSNNLDTFPYNQVGISSNIPRPISWTKQVNDKLINGSFISKSRNEQSSKLYPTSKLIWNVKSTDQAIYVDNAYPLFIELDDGTSGLSEEKRYARIVKDYDFTPAKITANVSGTSTITSFNIINPGTGYYFTPKVTISSPPSGIQDPLYNWNTVSGISTSSNFNSIVQGLDIIIGVGNTNLVAISTNLTNWIFDSLNTPSTVNLRKVGVSTQNNYIAVGGNGKIFLKSNINSPWTSCDLKIEVYNGFVLQGLANSSYVGTFNDVIYNQYLNSWISVGEGGKIYQGLGTTPNTFIESTSQLFNYKAVDYNQNIMLAVGHSGISQSTDGKTWNNVTGIPSISYNSILWDGTRFIITSNNGIGILDENGNNYNLIVGSPTNLSKISYYNGLYIGLDFNGKVYHSFNLSQWELRTLPTSSSINDIKTINVNNSYRQCVVGAGGTILYSIPVRNKARLESSIVNSGISSINIIDQGFGYSSENPPSILVEEPNTQTETLYSINAVGDFGRIVGIKTSNVGVGTTSPSISFELLSDYSESGYDTLNTYGINFSNLSVGDYFLITNSNVQTQTGYALTGITTSLGGMSNYPSSRVGTATTFIDGVYKVEAVNTPNISQGITTVTCNVVPVNGGIGINTNGITGGYYGNYSWSKIFNYEDRATRTPLDLNINTNNGLTGLSTAYTLQRIQPLVF